MDDEDRIYDSYVDIGADEAFSCDDDLSEDDIYNPIDWNADGIINIKEFSRFAQAWLDSWSDPNDHDLYDIALAGGDDEVDIDDFVVFAENWLWEACWHKSQRESYSMAMMMDGESMMAIPMLMMETTPIPAPEPTAEEKISTIEEILVVLDDLWINDTEFKKTVPKKQWNEFTGTLETMLYELENGL